MSVTVLSPRAEREALARKLRDDGLVLREIAERMGVAISTASAYLTDPGGVRLQERKASYRGVCDECGGPTDGSNGRSKAPRRCMDCIHWPTEAIIEALRVWAEEHGRAPREQDWLRAAPGRPTATVVGRRLGWNRALQLAELPLHQDKTPERQAWIEGQLRAGRTVAEVAAELGVSNQAIYGRLYRRGLSVSRGSLVG